MYIDPIYNKYTSIEDEELGKEAKQLLGKAGIEEQKYIKWIKVEIQRDECLYDRNL